MSRSNTGRMHDDESIEAETEAFQSPGSSLSNVLAVFNRGQSM